MFKNTMLRGTVRVTNCATSTLAGGIAVAAKAGRVAFCCAGDTGVAPTPAPAPASPAAPTTPAAPAAAPTKPTTHAARPANGTFVSGIIAPVMRGMRRGITRVGRIFGSSSSGMPLTSRGLSSGGGRGYYVLRFLVVLVALLMCTFTAGDVGGQRGGLRRIERRLSYRLTGEKLPLSARGR